VQHHQKAGGECDPQKRVNRDLEPFEATVHDASASFDGGGDRGLGAAAHSFSGSTLE
jgi:hypothetical protein